MRLLYIHYNHVVQLIKQTNSHFLERNICTVKQIGYRVTLYPFTLQPAG
ncbi:hypothetical protein IM793_05370 [Pedobacter sp. MR2016-19]|nr:hypothetical protein [Pedobacter sp. MR2016-19]MBE5318575.1 hypothetical protein [Pedobacter sp. MR2016-19]